MYIYFKAPVFIRKCRKIRALHFSRSTKRKNIFFPFLFKIKLKLYLQLSNYLSDGTIFVKLLVVVFIKTWDLSELSLFQLALFFILYFNLMIFGKLSFYLSVYLWFLFVFFLGLFWILCLLNFFLAQFSSNMLSLVFLFFFLILLLLSSPHSFLTLLIFAMIIFFTT